MAGRTCPSCRSAVDDEQEYCLECGARLPSPWGDRTPPPPWVWLALGALALVALVSGVIVAVLASHDEDPVAAVVTNPPAGVTGVTGISTVVVAPTAPTTTAEPSSVPTSLDTIPIGPSTDATDTGEQTTLPIDGTGTDASTETDETGTDFTGTDETGTDVTGTDSTETTDTDTDAATATTDTETSTSDPGTGAGDSLVDWPSGQDGFTVVLASVPESQGESAARARAESAVSGGLAEVGVLRSSDFSNLNPGFWVVFAGIYTSLDDARSALGDAQSGGFPSAYTRRISS